MFTGVLGDVMATAAVMCLSALVEDPALVGLYGLAAVIQRVATVPMTAYLDVSFPKLARSSDDVLLLRRLRKRVRRNVFLLSLSAALATALAAPVAVPLVFGDAYTGSVPALWILLAGKVAWSTGAAQGRSLVAASRVQGNFWATVLAVAVSLSANIALIPIWGIEGAAVATALTQVVWSVVVSLICRRFETQRMRSVSP
jgi:O-antigen/teichoic acid export membrane protein